jgi:hypothetical protein
LPVVWSGAFVLISRSARQAGPNDGECRFGREAAT